MRKTITYLLFTLLVGILLIVDLKTGSRSFSFSEIMDFIFKPESENSLAVIFWEYRFPRLVAAIFTGIGLSVGGLLMQSYFRNPLAGPYIIGIGSGASFGVALFIMASSVIGISTFGNFGIISSAFLGSFLILFIIGLFSLRFKSNVSLLIVGLMLSYLISALITFLQSISSAEEIKEFVLWGMGSFSVVEKSDLLYFGIAIILGLAFAFSNRKNLDAYYLPDFEVETLGISLSKTRISVFISVALLVGSVTAFCGPIAFLGMAVPHISRMIFKNSNHSKLIPQSILIGITLAILFDIISQTTFNNLLIPINTIASAFGAPIVIWLLWKKRSLN